MQLLHLKDCELFLSAYRNSWTLDAKVGLWALDSGPCTLDSGHWTLDVGLWTLDSRRWTLDTERSTVEVKTFFFFVISFSFVFYKLYYNFLNSNIYLIKLSENTHIWLQFVADI